MSYILDALKRAEAERDRGAVPGLNARPVPLPAPTQPPGSRQALWLALGALLALGGAATGWWFWHSAAPAATVAMASPAAAPGNATAPAVTPMVPAVAALPAPPPPSVPAAQPPQAAPAATAAVTAPVPAPAPLPATAAVPTPAPAKTAPQGVPAAPTPMPVVAPTQAPVMQPPVKAAAPSPAATPAPAQPTAMAAATTAAPAANNLPLLNELPADLRSQLPKMTITGAVYSKDPSQRLLLINNQVFTQGSNVAPGLDLQEIQPHHAIFNFQGTRFRMAH